MNIGLCGWYGKGNFGDDLMADKLSKVLKAKDEDSVYVFSDCESSYARPNVYDARSDLFKTMDAYVIGGGMIVDPKFWLFRDNHLAQIRSRKVAFVNVNVTKDLSSTTYHFQDMLRNLNAKWWVRDTWSADRLKEMRIDADFIPDICFTSLDTSLVGHLPPKQLSVFLNSHAFADSYGYHATNLSAVFRNESVVRVLAQFLDWMTHWDWQVTFYPAMTGERAHDDRIPAGLVKGCMSSKAEWVVQPLHPFDLRRAVRLSDFVLSMRYHATVAAMAHEKPVIDVCFHDKTRHMMHDMNATQHTCEFAGLTVEGLIEKAQLVEKSRSYHEVSEYTLEEWATWFASQWSDYLHA